MRFIDKIKIFCFSGSGGDGSVHFRREKHVPKGGPNGGDGGKGGNIILKGNSNLWTLWHLRYKRHFKAGKGENGSKAKKTGKNGNDVVIEVPLGVQVKDENENLLTEITTHNQSITIFEGGIGGKGNYHFATPQKRSPLYAQPGGEGVEKDLILELKLLADVGLVGFPNAGKSTLLAHLSKAKPKIADYPFTTLIPNLGVVPYKLPYSFTMADIPGIIEGASTGKGLGIQFLQHIERNAVLLFVIDLNDQDIWLTYQTLIKELEYFNKELLYKPRLIALNKLDIISPEDRDKLNIDNFKKLDIPYCFISGATGEGSKQLKDLIFNSLTI